MRRVLTPGSAERGVMSATLTRRRWGTRTTGGAGMVPAKYQMLHTKHNRSYDEKTDLLDVGVSALSVLFSPCRLSRAGDAKARAAAAATATPSVEPNPPTRAPDEPPNLSRLPVRGVEDEPPFSWKKKKEDPINKGLILACAQLVTLSFRLDDDLLTRRRSLSLSESLRRRLRFP